MSPVVKGQKHCTQSTECLPPSRSSLASVPQIKLRRPASASCGWRNLEAVPRFFRDDYHPGRDE